MNKREPTVYMMVNKRNGTIYLGVTSNLVQRVWQHKDKVIDGFSKNYNTTILVYYERHDTMETAIAQEKKLKGSSRSRKLGLIETLNPQWQDLYEHLCV